MAGARSRSSTPLSLRPPSLTRARSPGKGRQREIRRGPLGLRDPGRKPLLLRGTRREKEREAFSREREKKKVMPTLTLKSEKLLRESIYRDAIAPPAALAGASAADAAPPIDPESMPATPGRSIHGHDAESDRERAAIRNRRRQRRRPSRSPPRPAGPRGRPFRPGARGRRRRGGRHGARPGALSE